MTIRRPLDGMLVLDLGQIYNGPYAGLNLGFMGARVLKIEPPEGDVVRRRKREVEPWPLVMLNSNKESVVLDSPGSSSNSGRPSILHIECQCRSAAVKIAT